MRVFDLSLGQMLWSRRSVFLVLLVAGPVLLAASFRGLVAVGLSRPPRISGDLVGSAALFGTIIWFLYIRFIVPALGVFVPTPTASLPVVRRTTAPSSVHPSALSLPTPPHGVPLYTSSRFVLVLKNKSPSTGFWILLRWPRLNRGSSNPALDESTSRIAEATGVIVPAPSESVTRTVR